MRVGLTLVVADKCLSGLRLHPHYSCRHEKHRAAMMMMVMVLLTVMVMGWLRVAPHRCWQWLQQAFDRSAGLPSKKTGCVAE